MFSNSESNTPAPTSKNATVPIHETIGESITWVNDWFSPNFNSLNTSNMLLSNAGSESCEPQYLNSNNANSLQLRGWFKTNHNHKPGDFKTQEGHDFLDLSSSKWRYLKNLGEDAMDSDLKVNEKVKKESAASEYGNTI
ncbi:uncharacterized protein LODBEIA_P02400 [Lodderomyces beijingensis]|uniref:Uncharacterized protein n=1 Tax=Lodderomyces beijingensis TaxID=1775926 RepID=A0ABP0ZGP6_9ASCO